MPAPTAVSFWSLVVDALLDTTVLMLLAAGGLSLVLGLSLSEESDWIEGAAILASVVIVVLVSSITNYQKEQKFRELNTLKDNIPVRVRRDGRETLVSVYDLVVGDVVLVETGDIVPADGLLCEGGELKVDESHMTGESDDVIKSAAQQSILLAGSKVLEGFGVIIVIAVGRNSQQGLINALVLQASETTEAVPSLDTSQEKQTGDSASWAESFKQSILTAIGKQPEPETGPAIQKSDSRRQNAMQQASEKQQGLNQDTFLVQKLEDLAGQIGDMGILAAASVLIINVTSYTVAQYQSGGLAFVSDHVQNYLDFVITAITILVVAVPEGLPLAVTLALAFSVQRMLADNNLVRHLDACETMATATTICTDKTGTLTASDMEVRRLWAAGQVYQVHSSTRFKKETAAIAEDKAKAKAGKAGHQGARPLADFVKSLQSLFNPAAYKLQLPDTAVSAAANRQKDDSSASSLFDPTVSINARSLPSSVAAAAAVAAMSKPDTASGSGSPTPTRPSLSSLRSSNGSAPTAPPTPSHAASGTGTASVPTSHSPSHTLPSASLSPSSSRDIPGHPRPSMPASILAQVDSPPSAQDWPGSSPGQPGDASPTAQPSLPSSIVEEGEDDDDTGSAAVSSAPPRVWLRTTSTLNWDHSSLDRVLAEVEAEKAATQGGATTTLPRTPTPLGGRSLPLVAPWSADHTSDDEAMLVLENEEQQQYKASKAPHPTHAGEYDGSAATQLPSSVEELLITNLLLNSTAHISCDGESGLLERSGNRTECALLELIMRLCDWRTHFDTIRSQHRVIETLAFTSARKRMSVLVAEVQGVGENGMMKARLHCKGAAEILLELCSHQRTAEGVAPLDDSSREALITGFSRDGLRMLALAYRDVELPTDYHGVPPLEDLETNLTLIALAGLEDPLRRSVPGAIAQCSRAGIAVRMLTGDNATTATAIARQCGILPADVDISETLASSVAVAEDIGAHVKDREVGQESGDGTLPTPSSPVVPPSPRSLAPIRPAASTTYPRRNVVLEGPMFRRLVSGPSGELQRDAFLALWPQLAVLARCSPSDKHLLVTALKELRADGVYHEVVAMTGDGTNDAPALRMADVGFAMNSGTPIAKDAADILLLDNNFASIVSAVKWGRNVYASITKFLQFQLTASVVAVATAAVGAMALQASPLSAVQMLWVNLIMDSLASLALATEEPSDRLLDMAPITRDQPLINDEVVKNIAGQAVFQLGVLYGLVFWGPTVLGVDGLTNDTLVFNTFVMMQLFNQLNCRKVRGEPNVLEGILHHPLCLGIVMAELALQVAIVQCGGTAFHTTPLTGAQWLACTGAGALTLLVRQGLLHLDTSTIRKALKPLTSRSP